MIPALDPRCDGINFRRRSAGKQGCEMPRSTTLLGDDWRLPVLALWEVWGRRGTTRSRSSRRDRPHVQRLSIKLRRREAEASRLFLRRKSAVDLRGYEGQDPVPHPNFCDTG